MKFGNWLNLYKKHTTRTCACVVHYGFRLVTQHTGLCLFKLSVYTHQFSQVILARPTMHAQSDLQFHQCSPNNTTKSIEIHESSPKRGSSMLSINTSWDQTSRVITDVWTSQTQRLFQGLWPALKPILNHLSSLKPTTPNPQNFPSQAASINIDSYKNNEKNTVYIKLNL